MVTTIIAMLTPKPLVPSSDWVAPSSGLAGSDYHIDWHFSPECQNRNSPDTTVGTDGNLGTKKMGLAGEFKFFSEFVKAETGATDWKQTKAGNQIHQRNLFQTDSSRFFSHFKKLKKTTRVP